MSRVFLTLLYFTNIYTSIICYSKCKEYIIVMKEVSCTNGSKIWEPIKLHDLQWDHDDCSADTSEILSYDEKYSNESYIVKFDYADSESICIPILKSTKLLDTRNIEILEDNIKESENKSSEISRTTDVEEKKDIEMKTSKLKCLIRNYTLACDKKNAKETNKVIDIDLIYANESTVKSLDSIINKKEDLLMFKECKVKRDLCVNRHPLLNISIFDEYIKNNHSIVKTIVTLINNGNGTVPVALNSNNFTHWNCTNASDDVTNIFNEQLTSLTYNILTKYACLNDLDNLSNTSTSIAPTYNVKLYIPMDFTVINTKMKHMNCEENFKIVNNNALGIYCNTIDIPVLTYTSTSTTTESNNISSTDTHMSESDLNCTWIWHCYLDNVIMSKEDYSEAVEIISKYKVLDFVNCTKDCKNIHRNAYKDSGKVKVIMISNKRHRTFKEHAPLINTESIILNFIPNLSDCDETILFNVTKGRIITLLPEDKFSKLLNKTVSTVLKLTIINCVNNYTKALKSATSLELILNNENNTNLNSFITNQLKITSSDSTERVILNCVYSDKNTNVSKLSDEGNSAMDCKFIELDNSKTTTKELYTDSASTSETTIKVTEKPKTNETRSEKDINITTENPTVATSKKDIKETMENPKEITTKKDTTTVSYEALTTESNTKGSLLELQKYAEMYDVSPTVLILAVAAVIAVVGSVSTYAFYLFRTKKTDYQIANTRDWAAMDETQF